jgi:hypothetical protein
MQHRLRKPVLERLANVDYDSTITHELGHVFRLHHPTSVDCHIDASAYPCNQNRVFEFAECTPPLVIGLDQATMCDYGHDYRTEQRTYHAWDLESLKRLYNCHLNGISCT